VIVPPRSTAVPSDMTESTPTQRDRHVQSIAEDGRIGWQKRFGYTRRALVEASIIRFKRVIGYAQRSRTEPRRAIEVAIAVHALNRMLKLGCRKSIRTTRTKICGGLSPFSRCVQHSRGKGTRVIVSGPCSACASCQPA
jgi:hypothetical protein